MHVCGPKLVCAIWVASQNQFFDVKSPLTLPHTHTHNGARAIERVVKSTMRGLAIRSIVVAVKWSLANRQLFAGHSVAPSTAFGERFTKSAGIMCTSSSAAHAFVTEQLNAVQVH